MRVVIQRVLESSVSVQGNVVGRINKGLNILVGFTEGDTVDKIHKMIDKILKLRIFDDENHIMNKSIIDINGSILLISQFTLYAETHKGNRPSYVNALNSHDASILYQTMVDLLRTKIHTEQGVFGADMKVNIVNDGPVTICMES